MHALQFIALDEAALQAIEMANLSKHTKVVAPTPERTMKTADTGRLPVFVVSSLDDRMEKAIRSFQGRGLLLFPEPERTGPMTENVLKSGLVPIPVKLESLATLSFSHAVKSVETLFLEATPEDFMLGAEDHFDVLKPHTFNRFYHAEGRHLREAVLRMAHRARTLRRIEGIAYTLQLPADTPLFALDEALDVLEIAVPPETPLLFAIRFDKDTASHVKISACIGSQTHMTSDIQTRIDAQPTYLGKTAVVVESFAANEIDEKLLEALCRDNGIEPEDADRLYDILYLRTDETASLMRHLRESRNTEERIDAIAKALTDGFIDVKILEELAILYRLPPDEIIARANGLKPAGSPS
ncbi:hypothetical protein [Hydrogenimonas cancrithermarum]|uniref:Uncharacterized protein n=1 Tax=Hydrogenimonas cancrithermarum TaxID=2993563 RepID=A0ABN6WSJ5_9BACT|nr:hypothetical protein [Hydrogenimonas cancrithermarum]BDY12034.1 hypothetical protein HCR_03460 [Hydrogenimonas cancrithermarum]